MNFMNYDDSLNALPSAYALANDLVDTIQSINPNAMQKFIKDNHLEHMEPVDIITSLLIKHEYDTEPVLLLFLGVAGLESESESESESEPALQGACGGEPTAIGSDNIDRLVRKYGANLKALFGEEPGIENISKQGIILRLAEMFSGNLEAIENYLQDLFPNPGASEQLDGTTVTGDNSHQ